MAIRDTIPPCPKGDGTEAIQYENAKNQSTMLVIVEKSRMFVQYQDAFFNAVAQHVVNLHAKSTTHHTLED